MYTSCGQKVLRQKNQFYFTSKIKNMNKDVCAVKKLYKKVVMWKKFKKSNSYLPNPSARAGYNTRSIYKRSLTGLNSEFSFS